MMNHLAQESRSGSVLAERRALGIQKSRSSISFTFSKYCCKSLCISYSRESILLYRFNDFRGITDSDAVSWDVVRDDGTGSYGTIIADGDTGQDGHVAADPDIITDTYGFSPFLTRLAFTRVCTMTRTVDMHARSYETIVADGHIGFVQDSKAEVRKEPFTDADMLAVVAIERLVDERVFIRLT